MWSDDVVVELKSLSYHHIDVRIKGETEFSLMLFYGCPRVQDRSSSWELLRYLKKDSGMPWIVIGDFNEIAHSWEMKGVRARGMWQMRNFRECLEDCGLTDLSYKGEMFTYSNRRRGDQEVKVRLDRAVANESWREAFPQAIVKHDLSYTSDYSPLIIYLKEEVGSIKGGISRFEQMWLRHERFKEMVETLWKFQHPGGPLSRKLKDCMQGLSRWGDETFGNVRKRIKNLKEEIQRLRGINRTEEIVQEEKRLAEELDEWLEREELWWRQRSRVDWLKNGDKNTAYFHARATQHRKRNYIENLRNSGVLCSSVEEINATITNYFTNLFQSQVKFKPTSI
ncbi:hypothetical protein QQ045_018356 [Rhodiola kirilowii]